MARPKSQTEYTRYTVRVPSELYERLALAAGEKSVNAEIVERLFRSFDVASERDFLTMLIETPEPKVLPPGLAGRIQRKAEERNRTVSEEIIAALEKAYPVPATIDEMIEALSGMFERIDTRREGQPHDPAENGLRLYLDWLVQERDAGRGEDARSVISESSLRRLPDGTIVRVPK